MHEPARPWILPILAALTIIAGACAGVAPEQTGAAGEEDGPGGITISAIPDEDPEELQRRYGPVAGYLSEQLGVPVEYVPVTDYNASVNLFRAGDLDMVFFGGLTGVQARLQVPGAEAILQRDIDEAFHSVFIANTAAGIEPFDGVEGLSVMAGKRFTFGSESSTSGRLMPQYFLSQAGVGAEDFAGEPGFSGAHDATIELVEAGTFEAGALNEEVWESRLEAGETDTGLVEVVFRTPPYYDYHWVVRPELVERDGGAFLQAIKDAFLSLDPSVASQAEILEVFGAGSFVETTNSNYDDIEQTARDVGLIG